MEPLSHYATLKEAQSWLDRQYDRLGYTLGYSYFYCPSAWVKNAKIVSIGLNPGGDFEGSKDWEQRCGNAYVCQNWSERQVGGTALQQQVRKLFAYLGVPSGHGVLSFQYVPFRSPNWGSLKNQAEAWAIADALFRWTWSHLDPEVVVCFGKAAASRVVNQVSAAKINSVRLGWGRQTGQTYSLTNGGTLVALPHLSRFRIFSRPECQMAIGDLLRPALAKGRL